jgi:perosamine synthetase
MIPIFQPNLGDEELNEIADTFNSHWIGLGPKTKIFEDQFASYIGCKNAISVNSATAALHISLIASDVRPGDEVLVSAITFVSSAHVVIYCGAIPILVDVDPETLQMDPQDMQRKITEKTKAVIAVHYGYHPCEMDEILRIARNHGIAVIEDAANCAGAEYKGKRIGNLDSDYTCFSFEAKKNMTTGDGGMITTNKDNDIIDKIRRIRWVGMNKDTFNRFAKDNKPWEYDITELGFKYNMNDITASIGIIQLKKLDDMNNRKKRIVEMYNIAFNSIKWLKVPVVRDNVKPAYWLYILRINIYNRDLFMKYLFDNGILANTNFKPLHQMTFFNNYYKNKNIAANCPVAEREWKSIVVLPLYPDMNDSDIEMIINSVIKYN